MINSISSERATLAGLISHPDEIYNIDDILISDNFSHPGHQQIYAVIRNLVIDGDITALDKMMLITGASQLGLTTFKTDTKSHELIDALMVTPIKKENVREFALKVKAAAVKRGLAQQMKDAVEIIENDKTKTLSDAISLAESSVFEYINSLNTSDVVRELSDGFLDWANEMADCPQEFQGLKTQFSKWDKAIGGGLRNGTAHIVGARAKAGKSAFILNIAENIAITQRIPVLYLDTELSFEYQRVRFGSLISGVPSDDLENGSWRSNKDNVESVKEAWEKMQGAPLFHVSVPGKSMESIISIIRRFISKNVGYDDAGRVNPCLIIYDYLKIMNSDELSNKMQEHQLLGFHLSMLHDIANVYQIPMVIMAQLNRDGIEKENESVIAGSDKITWFCSSFSILKKKSQEEIAEDGADNGNVKLKCILTRYGHNHDDDDYINIHRDDKCWRFKQGKARSDICANVREQVEKAKITREQQNEIKAIDDKK